MKFVQITQNKFAIVDDEDFERINQYKWHATKAGNTYYASHSTWNSSRKRKSAIFMHRIILRAPKGMCVDHINGNGLDNRKINLRLCTAQQNSQYRPHHNLGSSQYHGVHWHKKKKRWQSLIETKGKCTFIGLFKTEEGAALAYDKKAKELFGEFATQNFSGGVI